MNAGSSGAHPVSCTLTVRHFTFCLQRAALYYICVVLHEPLALSAACWRWWECGIKGFLHPLTHAPRESPPLPLLFLFFRPAVCVSGSRTDSPNRASNVWMTAFLLVVFFPVRCVLSLYFLFFSRPPSNDFSRMVAEEYLSFFNFTSLSIDQALRWEHTVQ